MNVDETVLSESWCIREILVNHPDFKIMAISRDLSTHMLMLIMQKILTLGGLSLHACFILVTLQFVGNLSCSSVLLH